MSPVSTDRKSAVALSYADKTRAPVVVAKGYGVVADSIVRRARESGLYVHESPDLVKVLMEVKLDQQIPEPLYLTVAELLAWVYQLEQGVGEPQRIAPAGPAAG